MILWENMKSMQEMLMPCYMADMGRIRKTGVVFQEASEME